MGENVRNLDMCLKVEPRQTGGAVSQAEKEVQEEGEEEVRR